MWVVKYTSTADFIKTYGFSLVIRKSFKSEHEAVQFANQLKKDDENDNVIRTVTVYRIKSLLEKFVVTTNK